MHLTTDHDEDFALKEYSKSSLVVVTLLVPPHEDKVNVKIDPKIRNKVFFISCSPFTNLILFVVRIAF